jgi:hypothetical protein
MFAMGSKNIKPWAPSRLQFREHVCTSGTSISSFCWQFAIQTIMTDTQVKAAAPQTSRPSSSLERPPQPSVHQLEPSMNKKPQRVAGALDPEWMRQFYILALQVLPFASQTPPALVQSAFVFAVVTSAAKAGAVKANASPNATVAQTSFFIGHLLQQTKLACW